MLSVSTPETLRAELEELRLQLQEANNAIEAIRNGEVDAVVVRAGEEHKLYTLQSADHTYRVFIEKMKEGAITLSRDGIILYSNSQFASLVGLPLPQVIGLPIIEFIPRQFHDVFKKIVDEGWHSDGRGEIVFKNKNNEFIPFQLSITSLELEGGEALSMILTDLTSQKENEKQLNLKNQQLEHARAALATMNEALEDNVKERTRELLVSREYFKFLADNIPVIVWTTHANGYADYFNKQWYEYSGLGFEDSKGWGSKQAIHPEDVELKRQAWAEAIRNKTAFQLEYRIRRADGEYRWHLGKGEPLKDEAGNIIGTVKSPPGIAKSVKDVPRLVDVRYAEDQLQVLEKLDLRWDEGELQRQFQPFVLGDLMAFGGVALVFEGRVAVGSSEIGPRQRRTRIVLGLSQVRSACRRYRGTGPRTGAAP